ncbi:MAG TPA: PAS domain S-box protein [Gemmatimonadales bacterium]|jgi:PAS domain S-box-containing protein|nr:PAS domain S-box protein [Gemmatimonadales bacterium]
MRIPEDVDSRVSDYTPPESDVRFRTLADTAPVFIWTSGTDNKCDWFNSTWQTFTGRTLEQEVGDGWLSGIHPDDIARVIEADTTAFQRRAPFEVEYRLRRHDGAYRWILDTGVPRFAPDGNFLGYIGTSLDIHDRRMAEEELIRREQQFVSLAESLPDMIARYDREGRYLYVNSATTALTGRPAEYYVGRSVLENDRPRELLETWHRAIMGVFETGTPSYLDFELTVQETLRRFEARFVPERGADGSVAFVISIARDVTTNRQAEERARQSAKMEAIGRLAGGLAHDLNNQLQAVVGFTTFLARDPGLSEQGRRDVAEIDKSSDRMRSLVAQLLAFSRQQVLSPETLDLNAAVVEAQALLQRLIGPTIDMQLELEAGPKWTRVDRTQFLQVLMNLTINARDALPNGGRVVFRTRVHEVKEDGPDFTGSIITAGRYVELQVADSGTGISPEHLSRIFEPFFTTKPVGKGTGLGLATVHGIVAQSRGHIKVESSLGQGTSFTILLPAVEDSGEIEVGSPPAGPGTRPSGCILVVEDEDVVRQVIVRILQETGYQTVEARHGLEALDILNRDFASITLVLTDLIMPVMTGIELTRRLADTGMAIPIVWMSGHPLEAIPEAQTGAETLSFLAKPINPAQLVDLVARLTAPA